jgi:hypothetical protein
MDFSVTCHSKKKKCDFQNFFCPHPHFKGQRGTHIVVSDRELGSLNKSFFSVQKPVVLS